MNHHGRVLAASLALLGCRERASSTPASDAMTDAASAPSAEDQAPSSPPSTTVAAPLIDSGTTMATPPDAYTTAWIDGTRSSRTHVAIRSLAAMNRVASFDMGSRTGRSGVDLVLVSPDGEHAVVRHTLGLWTFDRSGRQVGSIPNNWGRGAGTVLRAGELLLDFHGHGWTGGGASGSIYIPSRGGTGRLWAEHVAGGKIFVVHQRPTTGNHASTVLQTLEVAVNQLDATRPLDKLLGFDRIEGAWGLGAITPTGKIAVLTLSGDLRIYFPETTEKRAFKRVIRTRIGFQPYEASAVGESIAALESIGVPAKTEYGLEGSYEPISERFQSYLEHRKRWRTVLHLMSPQGYETGRAAVAFEVLQPPIDGGSGRIYLTGMGFASVQDGRVARQESSDTLTLATAFAGGELALVVGPELRIVGRDGAIRQSFRTDGEAIEAPPSIAPDGSVWVATETALYVAH